MPLSENLPPEDVVDLLLQELGPELPDDDAVSGAIAETNASGWGMDDYQIHNADRDGDTIAFSATVHLTGEQSDDHGFNGNKLTVSINGTAELEDSEWTLESYDIEGISSNVDDDHDDFDDFGLTEGAMDGIEVHKVLVARGVTHLHHANTVATSCSFLRLGALASRGCLERRGYPQTPQPLTDDIDKRYGIWDDVFVDGVDIHERAGRAKGPNHYGPVLFKMPADTLLHLPEGTDVMVTKKNPYHWKDGDQAEDRYFLTAQELQDGYRYGDFGQHIILRTRTGLLPFAGRNAQVILDDPQLTWQHGPYVLTAAFSKLHEAAKAGGVSIPCSTRACQPGCICVAQYASRVGDFSRLF